MRRVFFDLETYLIEPGRMFPTIVSVACAIRDDAGGTSPVQLWDRETGVHHMRAFLTAPDTVIHGHNVSFDLGCLCAHDPALLSTVFDLYATGRVVCTQVHEQLLRIAHGDDRAKVSLADCVQRYTGVDITGTKKGEDVWRLRYAELDGLPIHSWPEAAARYAMDDVSHLIAVHDAQQTLAAQWSPNALQSAPAQVYSAWTFRLAEAWGVRIDPVAVAKVKARLQKELGETEAVLRDVGILRPDGTRDTKRLKQLVEDAYITAGKECPRTEKGDVATDKLALLATGNPLFQQMVAHNSPDKLLSTFIPALEKAQQGRGILNPGYNVVVNSGRSSCRNPNIQNIAKGGGIRECFVPRDGCVFVGVDYDTLEMRALAQVLLDWFGQSAMADAINAGRDLHLDFAAQLLGIPYEETVARYKAGDKETKRARDFGKIGNFGFPGGLGPAAMVDYAFGWGIVIDEATSRFLKTQWLAKWPEMRLYFRRISDMTAEGETTIVQHMSGRYRGRVIYTSACNTFFQGLAADGAKEALAQVSREAYTVQASPLFGTRPVFFVHDEIIIEVPAHADVHAAGHRLAQVMVDCMQRWIPRVQITASPVAMTRWSKSAKEVFDADGRLAACVVEPP